MHLRPTRRDSSPGCDTRAIAHARTLSDTAVQIAAKLPDAYRPIANGRLRFGDDLDHPVPTSMLSPATCKVGGQVGIAREV
jgi:hypothetical protein